MVDQSTEQQWREGVSPHTKVKEYPELALLRQAWLRGYNDGRHNRAQREHSRAYLNGYRKGSIGEVYFK